MSATGPILVTYQCDPEFRLQQAYSRIFPEMELETRKIDTSQLFIQGHPMYEMAAKEGPDDARLPRVGIEWESDREIRTLGGNQRRVRLDTKFACAIKERLEQEGATAVIGNEFRNAAEYEQVSAKKINDFLNLTGYIDYVRTIVESTVLLTGWATGNAGRKTAQWLFQAIQPVWPFVATELRQLHGATMRSVGEPQVNLVNDQFGAMAYGFEMRFVVSQIRTCWRHLGSTYRWPKRPDIHMVNSMTELFPDA